MIRSVVWDRASLSKAAVNDSIVGHGVALPEGTRLDNVMVSRRLDGVDYPEGLLQQEDLVAVAIDPARPFAFE